MFQFKHILIALVFCWAAIGLSQETKSDSVKQVNFRLVWSEWEYDFGIAKSDTVLSHIFTFNNASSDTIKINKVTSS